MCPIGYWYCERCKRKVASSEVSKKEHQTICGSPVIWKSLVTMTGERYGLGGGLDRTPDDISAEIAHNESILRAETIRCFRVKAKRYAGTDLSRFTDDELWKMMWEMTKKMILPKCEICVLVEAAAKETEEWERERKQRNKYIDEAYAKRNKTEAIVKMNAHGTKHDHDYYHDDCTLCRLEKEQQAEASMKRLVRVIHHSETKDAGSGDVIQSAWDEYIYEEGD